jgi:hypothetical protein
MVSAGLQNGNVVTSATVSSIVKKYPAQQNILRPHPKLLRVTYLGLIRKPIVEHLSKMVSGGLRNGTKAF